MAIDRLSEMCQEIISTLELLSNEHLPIGRLFRDFEIPSNPLNKKDKRAIITDICRSMKQYLLIETDILYPAARKIQPLSREFNCGIVETSILRYIIADIESTNKDEPMLDATIQLLGEYSLQHFSRQGEILLAEIQELCHEHETRHLQSESVSELKSAISA